MFPEHELKVAYPLGGEHVCLVWYERNRGHHVIVARSESACAAAFRRVLAVHGPVELKSYEALQLVAPPDSLKERHAREELLHERDTFWTVYMSMALEYERRHGRLPKLFARCTEKVEPDDDFHCDCTCRGRRVLLTTGDLDSEFMKRRDAYLKRFPRRDPDGFSPSKAAAADPTLELFAATAQFGHHCTGVAMGEDGTTMSPVLFFYQRPRALPRGQLQQLVDAAMKVEKERLAARHRDWDAKKRQRDLDDDAEVEAMFG